jgi:hypothetical protein
LVDRRLSVAVFVPGSLLARAFLLRAFPAADISRRSRFLDVAAVFNRLD